jgi:hypothetical protein
MAMVTAAAIEWDLSEHSSSPRPTLGLRFRVHGCVRCFCVVAIPSKSWEEVDYLATGALEQSSAGVCVDDRDGRREQ